MAIARLMILRSIEDETLRAQQQHRRLVRHLTPFERLRLSELNERRLLNQMTNIAADRASTKNPA